MLARKRCPAAACFHAMFYWIIQIKKAFLDLIFPLYFYVYLLEQLLA
jgi:hypothetical protein